MKGKMRKELGLSPAILTFENLDELLFTMDEYIAFHKQMLEKYGDRLGVLLRNDGSADDSFQSSRLQIESQEMEQILDKRKEGKRRDSGEDVGWISFESEEYALKVAKTGQNAPSSVKEISALFKIIESLKSKIGILEVARRFLDELPSKGFAAEQKFLVVFRDGIPRQVIPTNESHLQRRKFRYSEEFEVEILE